MDEWHYKPAQDLGMREIDRLRSVKRESGLAGMISHHFWWWSVRAILRLVNRIEIFGRERLPTSVPFVIVANHSSHLDVLVLATALPLRLRAHTFPIAAGDAFFETPAVALFSAGLINALPMWRKNCGHHAIEALRQRLLNEPCGYILFPEGTRTRTGKMNEFRLGIGMLVSGTDVSVVPCHLEGTFEALPPGATWLRPGRIALRIGAAHRFKDVPNDRSGWQTVAQSLETAVRGMKPKGID